MLHIGICLAFRGYVALNSPHGVPVYLLLPGLLVLINPSPSGEASFPSKAAWWQQGEGSCGSDRVLQLRCKTSQTNADYEWRHDGRDDEPRRGRDSV